MNKIIFSILLIILILKISDVRAQRGEIDSLLNVLPAAKEDTSKVQKLIIISSLLIQEADYNKSSEYANSALKLAEKLKYNNGIGGAYDILGNIYTNQGNYPVALNYFLKELKIFEDTRNKRVMTYLYFNIGNIYEYQGNSATALTYYLKAKRVVENSSDKFDLSADNYNTIGIAYREQGNYAEAMFNLFKGLKIAEENNDLYYTAAIYSNIGTTYNRQDNYDEALKYHLKALKVREEIGNENYLLLIYNLIGYDYEMQKHYEDALKYYLQSLENYNEAGNKYGVALSFITIGQFYSRQSKYSSAIDSLNKGVALAREIGSKELIKDGYHNLADTYYHLPNLDSTYHYFNLFSKVKDTLLNEESSKEINEMQVQYETEKKDKEITQLNLESEKKKSEFVLLDKQRKIAELNFQNEQQQRQLITSENDRNKQSLMLADNLHKQQQDSISNLSVQKTMMSKLAGNERNKRNYAVAGGIGIAMFLSLTFYQLYRRRETRNTLVMNQLKNKVLRSQLNPHFIFNALNSIKNFIQQHPDVADNYLTKFSILMRQVLENSEEEKIPLSEEIGMIENYMQLESLRLPMGFDYEVSLDPSIDAGSIMVPPLILQPMIENAIWHGLKPLKHRGKISLLFTERNGLLEAVIEDDGVGLGSTLVNTASAEKKRSMGMQITRERIELMNRKARVKGWLQQQLLEQGSNVRLAIPVQ